MRMALMWLNLYGCEALRHKPQKIIKTPKMHFLPVFELMSDSLTTIYQCPSNQSILHIQGPIPEIFTKKRLRIGDALKMTLVQFLVFQFLVIGLFNFFFSGQADSAYVPLSKSLSSTHAWLLMLFFSPFFLDEVWPMPKESFQLNVVL